MYEHWWANYERKFSVNFFKESSMILTNMISLEWFFLFQVNLIGKSYYKRTKVTKSYDQCNNIFVGTICGYFLRMWCNFESLFIERLALNPKTVLQGNCNYIPYFREGGGGQGVMEFFLIPTSVGGLIYGRIYFVCNCFEWFTQNECISCQRIEPV